MIFLSLVIAIPLAVLGFKRVELGTAGMSLIKTTSIELNNFKIEIPSIPMIPQFKTPNGFELVLNFLIAVVNGLSTLVNFIITLLNIIIQLLEFIFLIIKNLIQFKDSVTPYSSSVFSLSTSSI